ncbi:uncharacterized protein LOC128990498 [Macrosteles quadrilineatus]|uniref:uncharacterized protein LOC128990498 n=1 Tax=Macrosteles quadrilineatus TaxID=74068 RepID=UPI0023E3412E|nr:uncharacterized protein LOC128990498 [Macrosteles quadrilineatus]
MPYYYLLSEVPDFVSEPIYNKRTYKKPEPINLLLPSIHASRDHNVLDATSDAEEAVKCLLNSCTDSASWPSSEYCDENENTVPEILIKDDHEPKKCFDHFQPPDRYVLPPPVPSYAPVIPKYRYPSWAYDRVPAQVLEAARSLFYDRVRRHGLYSQTSRCPTDYELFAAWANLSRSNQMAFVAEVCGSFSPDQVHVDSLATQRAVMSLLASAPDSCSWPSFQYNRLQEQKLPKPAPRQSHPYLANPPYNPLKPQRTNPSLNLPNLLKPVELRKHMLPLK